MVQRENQSEVLEGRQASMGKTEIALHIQY